jgi:hypothetical protein
VKIIRMENGSLSELVSCLLDVTRGGGIPTGSVILLFSASHLHMRGVSGYMRDYMEESNRLMAVSRGGGHLPLRGSNHGGGVHRLLGNQSHH